MYVGVPFSVNVFANDDLDGGSEFGGGWQLGTCDFYTDIDFDTGDAIGTPETPGDCQQSYRLIKDGYHSNHATITFHVLPAP